MKFPRGGETDRSKGRVDPEAGHGVVSKVSPERVAASWRAARTGCHPTILNRSGL